MGQLRFSTASSIASAQGRLSGGARHLDQNNAAPTLEKALTGEIRWRLSVRHCGRVRNTALRDCSSRLSRESTEYYSSRKKSSRDDNANAASNYHISDIETRY